MVIATTILPPKFLTFLKNLPYLERIPKPGGFFVWLVYFGFVVVVVVVILIGKIQTTDKGHYYVI